MSSTAQVGFLMRVAMQRHTSIFMSNMIEDLTQTQFAVLAKLHEVGPSSQNHLGRLVYLDAATIKGVVDRLGLRGFITTGSDPTDRRRRASVADREGRPCGRCGNPRCSGGQRQDAATVDGRRAAHADAVAEEDYLIRLWR